MLLDHLAFLVKQILLEIFHNTNILNGIVPLIIDWVSLFIQFNRFTPDILNALFLHFVFKKESKLVLILFNSPLHAGVPMILYSVIGPALE